MEDDSLSYFVLQTQVYKQNHDKLALSFFAFYRVSFEKKITLLNLKAYSHGATTIAVLFT